MEKPAQLRLPELTEKDERRFWSKVALPNGEGCMLWMAGKDRGGYGQFRLNGRTVLAHRVAYVLAYGPIPEGLPHVDHVKAKGCTHRHCAAGGHLEAVTPGENIRRGETGLATGANMRAKTHCPQGHPYDEENTYITTDARRRCRTCKRAHDRNPRERKVA